MMEEIWDKDEDGADNQPEEESEPLGIEDEQSHARLLDSIASMHGDNSRKHSQRTVFGSMTGGDKRSVLKDMMSSIHKSGSHRELKKKMNKVASDSKLVDAPLPKLVQERIQRSVGYEKTVKDVTKWDSVVTANRRAEQIKFPLERPTQQLINSSMKFRPVTQFQKEFMAELAKQDPDDQIPKGKLFTPREEREMASMSLEEIKDKRRERVKLMQRKAAMISKLRWENGIKSKRYRRRKKKEKEKQTDKELETLAATDPQALLDKLEEKDRERIEARGRLRHRKGNRFEKRAKLFAKYDDEKRKEIQDMLDKQKELTEKQHRPSSSSESEDEDPMIPNLEVTEVRSSNAWMKSTVFPSAPSSQPLILPASEDEKEDSEDDRGGFLASYDRAGSQADEAPVTYLDKDEEKAEITNEEGNSVGGNNAKENPEQLMEGVLDSDEDELREKGEDDNKVTSEMSETKERKRKKRKRKKGLLQGNDEVSSSQVHAPDVTEIEEGKNQKKKRKKNANSKEKEETVLETTISENQQSENWQKQPKKKRKKNKDNKDSETPIDKTETSKKNKEPNTISPEELRLLAIVKGLQSSEARPSNETKTLEEKSQNNKATKPAASSSTNTKTPGEAATPRDVLLTIAEAFDDDDVVAEFVEEKRAVVEEETEKDVNLFLPGWGSWHGPGILPSKKKQQRFIKKAKPEVRADTKIGHVIISQKVNTAVQKHMLNKLPTQFKTVKHMKRALSKPIGREFNREAQFKKNVAPKTVVTRIGQIISPIDHSQLQRGGKEKTTAELDLHTKKARPAQNRNKKHKGRK